MNDMKCYLAHNPILFVWEGDVAPDDIAAPGHYYLTLGGKRIYDGRFNPPVWINLSEIVDANTPWFPEISGTNTEPVIQVESPNDIERRRLYGYFEYDTADREMQCYVFPGGVSKQNYSAMAQKGTDMMSVRFLNPAGNFFLTTRTADWCIYIKESEICPLYFFVRQTSDSYEIVDPITKNTMTFDWMEYGVCALDLAALRYSFYTEFGVLASIFDVYCNRVNACRIVITQASASRDRYRLKFRNSLGVFEIIELTGAISITPEYPDSEDATVRRYDAVIDDFYADRERIVRKLTISVSTGVKRPDEVRLLMDMLGSEDVYLLDLTPYPIKVIPSADDMTYMARPDTPQNFNLKLELADEETYIMQDIISGDEGSNPRIFTDEFNDKFN